MMIPTSFYYSLKIAYDYTHFVRIYELLVRTPNHKVPQWPSVSPRKGVGRSAERLTAILVSSNAINLHHEYHETALVRLQVSPRRTIRHKSI